MNKTGVIISVVVSFIFLWLISFSCAVIGADTSIENVLPAGGCSKNWVIKDKAALFNSETLFDHINGEAELYFPYGFELLATATYVNRGNPESWIVTDVYKMGSLIDAFGIYSNYRKVNSAWVKIGVEGFVSSSQLMFYQDRYFVRLQATGTTGLKQDIFLVCGRAISKNLPSNAGPPKELEILRIPGIVPKSERYIAKSLLGYAFFRRGIIADAIFKDEQVQVFLVPEDSQDAARKAVDRYRSYLKTEGQTMKETGTPNQISIEAVDPLYGGVFFEQSGRYIIGAIRLKNPSAAKQLVEKLRGRLDSAR
ncbi:MAG TPA: DUF6599 family protein [Syntrophales bacterium]|nr:DUF6599 family protein [Syntrophales bacterium]